MTRRELIAGMAAPVVAPLLPKPAAEYVIGVDEASVPDRSVFIITQRVPVYWHGQLPWVVLDIKRQYPWEKV